MTPTTAFFIGLACGCFVGPVLFDLFARALTRYFVRRDGRDTVRTQIMEGVDDELKSLEDK